MVFAASALIVMAVVVVDGVLGMSCVKQITGTQHVLIVIVIQFKHKLICICVRERMWKACPYLNNGRYFDEIPF